MKINYSAILREIVKANKLPFGDYIVEHNGNTILKFTYKNNEIVCNYSEHEKINAINSIINKKGIIKSDVITYFYFDENLHVRIKEFHNDEVDKVNKEQHNFYERNLYNSLNLEHDFWVHVKNMRLNLLANFYPTIQEEKTNNRTKLLDDFFKLYE